MTDLATAVRYLGATPDEHEYQTFMAFDPRVRRWRNAFTNVVGAPPQTEGGDFDYRRAYAAGERPNPVPGDVIPHWGSSGKQAGHPTEWKAQFVERFGVDPDEQAARGFSPEMQDFMRGPIGSLIFDLGIQSR